MRIPLTWNGFLQWRGTELVCLPDKPVCATCRGTRSTCGDHPLPCPACGGTGFAWYRHVVPTAGMMLQDGTGEWHIVTADDAEVIEHFGIVAVTGFTPLAPPRDCGLSDAEILAMLPGAETYNGGLFIPLKPSGKDVLYALWYSTGLELHSNARCHIDPDAAELAIQRYKALRAFLGVKP